MRQKEEWESYRMISDTSLEIASCNGLQKSNII